MANLLFQVARTFSIFAVFVLKTDVPPLKGVPVGRELAHKNYDLFRFQNIYLLDMSKKTLLILAIICLVFNQSFACKKKIKGAWKKIKPKKPKRYQKLSPSSSVSSSASDISFIFRSRQGKITMVTLSRYSKTSCKFILNCFRGIITSSDFKTFIF